MICAPAGLDKAAMANLQALAEECQLATDLWLAVGRAVASKEATSKDYFVARLRKDVAAHQYHALLWTAVFGSDISKWPGP